MARRDRCTFRTPLLIQRPGQAPRVGVTLDAGHGGIGFLCPGGVAQGDILDLEVVLEGQTLRMVVEVLWTAPRERSQRCGARIRAIGVRDALLLRQQLVRDPAETLRAAG